LSPFISFLFAPPLYCLSAYTQVFNLAALPRIVLLFDVLHASVYEDANLTAAGLAHFRKVRFFIKTVF
jgi:hypothetical protein